MNRDFRKRICLIIEDEPEIAELLVAAIEDLDIDVKIANSAEQGVAGVKNIVVDVAIIDIFMPGKGGIWAIQALQKNNPEIKIIAISGGWKQEMTSNQTLSATVKLGVHCSFTKPLDLDTIHDTVQELCVDEQG